MHAIRDIADIDAARFRAEILPSARPAVFRGLAAHWPAVRDPDPRGYLKRLATDRAGDLLVGPPDIEGRFFYDADMAGLNFTRTPSTLTAALDRLAEVATAARPPAIAMQSIPTEEGLPGFADENRIDLPPPPVRPRLWIGNRVAVATHHDAYSNIAVVVAGRRRFTLFPPDQVANLYVGPFEFTPAGTPVSLVDPEAPDLARFPRFAAALDAAETAELGPGDAIYIPHMWWHHVRSLDPLSVLANYWWNEASAPMPGLAPIDALVHTLLAMRDLPEEQRSAWAALFSDIAFGADPDWIPAGRAGIRGHLPVDAADRLRRQLGSLLMRPLRS